MKNKISIFLVLVMLFSALCGIGATAATPITAEQTYTHNFNVNTDVIKAVQGGSNVSLMGGGHQYLLPESGTEYNSKGLQLKATTSVSGEYVRCTNQFTPLETSVIPVGTYEVSFWVLNNDVNSSDWSSLWLGENTKKLSKDKFLTQAAVVFYGIGAATTNDLKDVAAGLEKGTVVKLFSDEEGSFTRTDETRQSTNGTTFKTWYKWTANVTLTQPCAGISFRTWREVEGTDSVAFTAYIDDLSIKGIPAQQSQGNTFRGVQESAVSGESFNVRLLSTVDSKDAYGAVGFEVSCTDGTVTKPVKAVNCQYVYDKITGSTENGIALEYAAEYYNSTYIAALTLTDLPAGAEELVITVTPYTIDKDGVRNTQSEKTYEITYKLGVFESIKEV